ncbi:MAG: hypothetical protein ACYTG5_21360, partial [Planctomycetota bacterium]
MLPLLCALLAAPALVTGQKPLGLFKTDNIPGGFFSIDRSVGNATGSARLSSMGVARAPNGHYFVSSRRSSSSGLHDILEFDPAGVFIQSIAQPAEAQFDFLGIRDLAWDGRTDANSRIWGGHSGTTLYALDWASGVFDSGEARQLFDFDGLAIDALAISDTEGTHTFVGASAAALAIGPGFGGNRVNYHRISDGLPLRNSTSDVGSGTGKWGAGYDPARNVVWWHIDDAAGNRNPNDSRSVFKEMDLETGLLTGQVVQGNPRVGGEAYGCDFYVDQNGDGVLVYLVTSAENQRKFGDVVAELYLRAGFGDACGGRMFARGESFVGNTGFRLQLRQAMEPNAGLAFLFQGPAQQEPGLIIPGVLDCSLLLDPGAFSNLGSANINAGTALKVRSI